MSGNADNPGNDEREWRVIVEKRRSIWERLTGERKILPDDAVVALIEQILSNEPQVKNLNREE